MLDDSACIIGAPQKCIVKCGFVRKIDEECSTEGKENNDDRDDNAE